MERKYESEKHACKLAGLEKKKVKDICFDLKAVAYMLGKYNDQQKDLHGTLDKCINTNGEVGKEEELPYFHNANSALKCETIKLSD